MPAFRFPFFCFPAKYIVSAVGSRYYVRKALSSTVVSCSDLETALNDEAFNGLTSGRASPEAVVFEGDGSLTDTILLPLYTRFGIHGRIKAATNLNKNMFELAVNPTAYLPAMVEIYGGVIDGNKSDQTSDFDGLHFHGNGAVEWLIHDITFNAVRGWCAMLGALGEARVYNLRGSDFSGVGTDQCKGGFKFSGCWDSHINDLSSDDGSNIGDGYYSLHSTAGDLSNTYSNIYAGGGAILLEGDHNTYSNINSKDGYLYNLELLNATYNSILGGTIGEAGTGDAMHIHGNSLKNAVTGLVFHSPSGSLFNAVGEGDNADYTTLTGCQAYGFAGGQWSLIGANSKKTGCIPA